MCGFALLHLSCFQIVLMSVSYLFQWEHFSSSLVTSEEDELIAGIELNRRLTDLMYVFCLLPAILELPEASISPLLDIKMLFISGLNRLDENNYPVAGRYLV
jgi:hypothetical protein